MALLEAESIPAHVPAELVWDREYYQFAAEGDDPFRRVGDLHSGPDIIWARRKDEGLGGSYFSWLPTRNALIREVLSDTDHFLSGPSNMMGAIGVNWKLIPLEFDPPQHGHYRKILEPFFSPAAINALDAVVRSACDTLIGQFSQKTSCEFARDFADKFPSYIFLDLMGMPKDRLEDFLAWERGMLRPSSPDELVPAMNAILGYFTQFIEEQRKTPTSSLMRTIMSASYNDQRPLTDSEILGMCYLLYIGGLDTVYSTLGWAFWHLAQDEPLQRRLRENPDDATRATDELLRAFSIASTQRYVAQDFAFHGVPMRAGDVVQISLPLGARDPQAYPDPHRIDIDRPARPIAFGTGPHTCLGLRLAKREIRIVLQSFMSSFRNLRIPAGERYAFHTGSDFGVDYLPLEWELA
jgi:cytochrome P450